MFDTADCKVLLILEHSSRVNSLSLHLSGSLPSRKNKLNRLYSAACALCLDAATTTEIPVRFTVLPGLVVKTLVMLILPLAVRREKLSEGSLSISESSSISFALSYFFSQTVLLTSVCNLLGVFCIK